MKRITTKSGSTYMLDETNKTIERVEGGGHYTGRGATGAQSYFAIAYPPTVGFQLCVQWEEGSSKAMVTNVVTEIAEVQ